MIGEERVFCKGYGREAGVKKGGEFEGSQLGKGASENYDRYHNFR